MRISALVIVSISVMMVVAILPAYSHVGLPDSFYTCPDNWVQITVLTGDPKDKNLNEHLCQKVTKNSKVIQKDDHLDGEFKP